MSGNYLTWGAMWCGEAWHMWCETPGLSDDEGSNVRSTEAGYVRFDPREYPVNAPPSVEVILWHVPVLRQQLAMNLSAKATKYRKLADKYHDVLTLVYRDEAKS